MQRHITVEGSHTPARTFSSPESAIQYAQRTISVAPARWIRAHNALLAGVATHAIVTAAGAVTFTLDQGTSDGN